MASASGAKLAAALAAGEGGGAAGQVMQCEPAGVELSSPPAPAYWNDLGDCLRLLDGTCGAVPLR
eukprot:9475151-Pyramimonas_sp.AAC.1